MSFTDEYNKVSKLLKEIDELDVKIANTRKFGAETFSYSQQIDNNPELYAELNKYFHKLLVKRSDLERKRDRLFSSAEPLLVRVGDLRDEIANYLEIDPKDVNLYARLISTLSPYSPGHHLISQSTRKFIKNHDSWVRVLFRVYYDESKNLNYDIRDAFIYYLNNSMTQADGINLLDHMYKRIDDSDSKNPRYKDVALENDQVEDLYIKVPFHLLFTKINDRLFSEGKLTINTNSKENNGAYEYYINEHRMEGDKQVEDLNVFRTCVINHLKKQDIKNKTLVKK